MSREQTSREEAQKMDEKVSEMTAEVTFFDNIHLNRMGEYLVRGQVKGVRQGDCLMEPIYVPELNMLVASCLCNTNENRIVPLRIWTFSDNIKVKKGMRVGKIEFMESSRQAIGASVRNIKETNSTDRWSRLLPQLENQLNELPKHYKKILLPLLEKYNDIYSL